MKSGFVILFVVISLVFSLQVFSKDLNTAVQDAVNKLEENGLSIQTSDDIVVKVINYHSQQFDREARIIQSDLYSTLQRKYQKAKILLLEESLTGASTKAVLIKGTYRKTGGFVKIELKAFQQQTGILFAKANSEYKSKQQDFDDLVVVLPLDAPDMKNLVIQLYTKVFRSALTEAGKFNLIAADEIDAVDADEIQKAYGCSREECSSIVAEQLNANLVITTQYGKVAPDVYYLAGSLKDIKTGKTITEKAIQHDGDLNTLDFQLKTLAFQLADTWKTTSIDLAGIEVQTEESSSIDLAGIEVQTEESSSIDLAGIEVQTEKSSFPQNQEIIEKDNSWPWWYWVVGIAGVGLVGSALSGSSSDSSSGGSDSESDDGTVSFRW